MNGAISKVLRKTASRTASRRMGLRAARAMSVSAGAQHKMACFQCEQTLQGEGCFTKGVCGKTPLVSGMQDLVCEQAKGLGFWATAARNAGIEVPQAVNEITFRSLFATVTNVNFDDARFVELSQELSKQTQAMKSAVEAAGAVPEAVPDVATIEIAEDVTPETLSALGHLSYGLEARRAAAGVDEDAFAAYELTFYGLKGVAAYGTHALELHAESADLFSEMHRVLGELAVGPAGKTMGDGVKLALDIGAANMTAMELLDRGHNDNLGAPEPTMINHAATEGKAILISGHDMRDLKALLEATEGTGVNVYTHGEMLPAHTYPELKKHKHLVGHYGGPWNLQHTEFHRFPGAIVMTTNCLLRPRPSYADRIFTMNEVGYSGTRHLGHGEFGPVIEAAKAAKGFEATEEPREILAGFGREALLGAAGPVLDAVSAGDLQRIVVIGGCDGSELNRSYYTELAEELPDQALMLTLGCGKFRVIGKKDYGNLPNTEIPRVLDIGQCNDAYTAIAVASALADKLGCTVHDLPLSIVLSWFEQKAVAVLLSLLHLGLQDIRIGPRPPAFVTPNLMGALVDNFNLTLIGEHGDEDVEAVMGIKPEEARADA